jgi:hypothetical protein
MGDALDGLEVPRRGCGEARLDHVYARLGELLGDLQLVIGVQRDPGGLLAVAQGGIKDDDAVCHY